MFRFPPCWIVASFLSFAAASTFYSRPCQEGQFWCTNNRCAVQSYVCDGFNDCGDSSDERSCYDCPPGTFGCYPGLNISNSCIVPALVCDGSCDCRECEDEDECYRGKPDESGGANFSFTALIICGCLILIGSILFATNQVRLRKRKRATAQDNMRQISARITEQPHILHRSESDVVNYVAAENMRASPDILSDLPPAYILSDLPPAYILSDLPPAYHTVVDNPVLVIDSVSLNEEISHSDYLPTYEEIEDQLATNTSAEDVNDITSNATSARH